MSSDTHPINLTLMHLLENQMDRTRCALEGLDNAVFVRAPGGGCNSIQDIGAHLIGLRRFQLTLLGVDPDKAKAMLDGTPQSADELLDIVNLWTEFVGGCIQKHDPDDWHAEPTEPREGPWPELPTLIRFVRPMNDFTNHLGSIRTIRRILGNPAEQTQ